MPPLVSVSVLVLRIPPPAGTVPVAVLPVTVVLDRVADPPAMLARPPPRDPVLPVMVPAEAVMVPKLVRPPPVPLVVLLEIVLLDRVAVPPEDKPPPVLV